MLLDQKGHNIEQAQDLADRVGKNVSYIYRSVRLLELPKDVIEELRVATGAHGPMRSAHEGYAVILEEVDELWEEVRTRNHSRERLYTEAKHVAAMALRFMRDVCNNNQEAKS